MMATSPGQQPSPPRPGQVTPEANEGYPDDLDYRTPSERILNDFRAFLNHAEGLKNSLKEYCRGYDILWEDKGMLFNCLPERPSNSNVLNLNPPKEIEDSSLKIQLSGAYGLGFIDCLLPTLKDLGTRLSIRHKMACPPYFDDVHTEYVKWISDLEDGRAENIRRIKSQSEEDKASLVLRLVKELIITERAKGPRYEPKKNPDDANIVKKLETLLPDFEEYNRDKDKMLSLKKIYTNWGNVPQNIFPPPMIPADKVIGTGSLRLHARLSAAESDSTKARTLVEEAIQYRNSQKSARHGYEIMNPDLRKALEQVEPTTLRILEDIKRLCHNEDPATDDVEEVELGIETSSDSQSLPTEKVPSSVSLAQSSTIIPASNPKQNVSSQRYDELETESAIHDFTPTRHLRLELESFPYEFIRDFVGGIEITSSIPGLPILRDPVVNWPEWIFIDPVSQEYAPSKKKKNGAVTFVDGRVRFDKIGNVYPVFTTTETTNLEYIGHYQIEKGGIMPLERWEFQDHDLKLSFAQEVGTSTWGRKLLQEKSLSITADERPSDILRYFEVEEEPCLRIGLLTLNYKHFDINGYQILRAALGSAQRGVRALPEHLVSQGTASSDSSGNSSIPAKRPIPDTSKIRSLRDPVVLAQLSRSLSKASRTGDDQAEVLDQMKKRSQVPSERARRLETKTDSRATDNGTAQVPRNSISPVRSFKSGSSSRSSSERWRRPSVPLSSPPLMTRGPEEHREDLYSASPPPSQRTLAAKALAKLAREYNAQPRDSPDSKRRKLRHSSTARSSQSSGTGSRLGSFG